MTATLVFAGEEIAPAEKDQTARHAAT